MPRRAAKVTQADIARVIRAAKKEGATGVIVGADGQIHIDLLPRLLPDVHSIKDQEWVPSQPKKVPERHLKRVKGT